MISICCCHDYLSGKALLLLFCQAKPKRKESRGRGGGVVVVDHMM